MGTSSDGTPASNHLDVGVFLSLEGCEDFVGFSYAGEAGEDFLEDEVVGFGVSGSAGVFDDNESEAETCALARGGFDADVGGDAGENDGVDPALLEDLFEVGAGESSPVTLGDEDIAGLEASFGD